MVEKLKAGEQGRLADAGVLVAAVVAREWGKVAGIARDANDVRIGNKAVLELARGIELKGCKMEEMAGVACKARELYVACAAVDEIVKCEGKELLALSVAVGDGARKEVGEYLVDRLISTNNRGIVELLASKAKDGHLRMYAYQRLK